MIVTVLISIISLFPRCGHGKVSVYWLHHLPLLGDTLVPTLNLLLFHVDPLVVIAAILIIVTTVGWFLLDLDLLLLFLSRLLLLFLSLLLLLLGFLSLLLLLLLLSLLLDRLLLLLSPSLSRLVSSLPE